MRTRTVRRTLWGTFLLLACLFVVDLYVTSFIEREQIDSLRGRLITEARMLSTEQLAKGGQLDVWVKDAATRAEARVTIVDRNGTALADSEQDAETAGAANQPEIQAALQGTSGNSTRRSLTTNQEVLYVAIPVHSPDSAAAALRLARSLDPPNASVVRLRYGLPVAVLFSLALAAVLVYIFRRRFSSRIALLRVYTDHLLDPQVSNRELPAGDGELGLLAKSLRRMAPRIRELVESLKLEGAQREAILASMVEGVLAVDKNLRVTFCNNSFARTVGTRIPVSPGMPLIELVRDPGLLQIMTHVLASGRRVERRLTLAAAEAHSFEVLAGPLGESPTRGALAILHDVTELERLERVRKDFVANVSHELRTPLAAIRGYAETLLDGALEDQTYNRRFVEIIQAQATRLTNIASDLLTLSELESNVATTKPRTVSVRSAMESALRTVELAAGLRGVQLICGKMEDVQVLGEELRLEQVFVNLLDNAVKFNRPNGEVRIEARFADGGVCITIADTGIGIPSEDLPRIFERFYRADKARSREMGGTGLGLSIVKHVMENMGGTVTIDSQLGTGSRFTLIIPAASVH